MYVKGAPRTAPTPKGFAPSPFVVRCLAVLDNPPCYVAVDLACGYGRHVGLLRDAAFSVIALDIDEIALFSLGQKWPEALAVNADLRKPLPLAPQSVGVAVVVHYPLLKLAARLASLLKPGGYAILESVGGQGENWQELPRRGDLGRLLKPKFDILTLEERPVGPSKAARVAVRVFAQRRGRRA